MLWVKLGMYLGKNNKKVIYVTFLILSFTLCQQALTRQYQITTSLTLTKQLKRRTKLIYVMEFRGVIKILLMSRGN